jgi:lysyl-tRNA synthetase class 2
MARTPQRALEREQSAAPGAEAAHRAWLAPLAACLAAAVGLLNVVSALTPELPGRLTAVLSLEPAEGVLVAHAIALPAGLFVLVSALHLRRRRRRAAMLAMGVLILLGGLDLLKGLDVEEAVLTWSLAGLLWWGRESFWVGHDADSLWPAIGRGLLVLAGAFGVAVVAVFTASQWVASDPGLWPVVREASGLLTLSGGTMHFTRAFEWVPLTVGTLGIVAVGVAIWAVFRPLSLPVARAATTALRAQRLVRDHGSDTLAFFKLRPDVERFFSADGRAFVSYRADGGVLMIAGDPVGPAAAVPDLMRELAVFASTHGLRLGAVGASERFAEQAAGAGLRAFYLGDEAIVDTSEFTLVGRKIRKVRQSVTRLEREGYTCELTNLSSLGTRSLERLEAISDMWLRGEPDRGFSMCMEGLRGAHLEDSRVLLARDGGGEIRGYLHLVPSYGRSAMSLSAMRRDPETPNGLTEYMVAEVIEMLREREVTELSLNFAAFARVLNSPEHIGDRMLGRFISLGNPIFQIESLYKFNAKFFPRWQPRYMLHEGPAAWPRTVVVALRVEGQFPTVAEIVRGLALGLVPGPGPA